MHIAGIEPWSLKRKTNALNPTALNVVRWATRRVKDLFQRAKKPDASKIAYVCFPFVAAFALALGSLYVDHVKMDDTDVVGVLAAASLLECGELKKA